MTPHTKSVLVVVAYYLEDAQQVERLIDRFEAETGLSHDVVLVVENHNPLLLAGNQRDVRSVKGDNSAWEFSGMVAGLKACGAMGLGVCTVLNDSYGRNWEVSRASRSILRDMRKWASRGGVAAWQDVFAWIPFQQRTNSRLLMIGGAALGAVQTSIQAAIDRERQLTNGGRPLFTEADMEILDRWEGKNAGRWSQSDVAGRRRRIYLEHTMLDALSDPRPRLFPNGSLSAVGYTVRRKLEGERR